MDKFIVRLVAILVNLYIPFVLVNALNGVDISNYDYILGDTIMLGLVLTVLSHSQGKYHCVWMRAMCYNLVITPIINFIDAKFAIFNSAESYIYVSCSIVLVTFMATLYLAIRHFIKTRSINNERQKLHRNIR